MNISQRKKDISRDKYLADLGYKILRFPNIEIYNKIENVLEKIRNSIN